MRRFKLDIFCFVAMASLLVSGCATGPDKLVDFEPIVRPVAPKPATYTNGSLFQQRSVSLFEDPKPHRIGDIITVLLQESTSASKNSGTSSTKEDDISMAAPTIFGAPVTYKGNDVFSMNIAPEREFSGESDSSQSNSLSGEITVTVVDILPNDNLVVQGEKWFVLNQGKEYIRIAGVIRPQDVSPDNTLSSSKLADAQIAYSGEGFLADVNNQGWLGQFMNSKWWPF